MDDWITVVVVLIMLVIFSMITYARDRKDNVFIEFSYYDPVVEKIRHTGNLIPESRRDIIKQIAVPEDILEIRSDVPIKLVGPMIEVEGTYFDMRLFKVDRSKLRLLI